MGSPCKDFISSCLQRFPTKTFGTVFKVFLPLSISLVVLRFVGPINVAFAARAVGTQSMGTVGISYGLVAVTATGLGNGLATSFETMAAKYYGAKDYIMVGILLQKSFLFLGFLGFLVPAFWVHMGAILKAIGIPVPLANSVEMYLILYVPNLLCIFVVRLMRAYLIIQKNVKPSFVASVLIVVMVIPFNYFFLYVAKLKVTGIAIANDLSYFLGVVGLLSFLGLKGMYKETWPGFTKRCFLDWEKYLMLAIPAAVNWFFRSSVHEIALVAVGTIGTVEVAAQTAFFTLVKALLTISLAVGMPMNINISKSFGEKDPAEAKRVTAVCILFNLLITCSLGLLMVVFKDYIGMIFTPDVNVQHVIAQVTPYVALSYTLEGTTTLFIFICFSMRLQMYSTVIYFISSYLIGLPLGIVLAIHWKGITFLWCGLAVGFCVQFIMYLGLFYWKGDFESKSEEKTTEKTPLKNNGERSPKYSPKSTTKNSETVADEGWQNPKDIEKEAEKPLLEKDGECHDQEEEISWRFVGKRCLALSTAVLVLIISVIVRVELHV